MLVNMAFSSRSIIIEKMMNELDCDLYEANELLSETINFLMACSRSGDEELTPSPMIDACWHIFVLHTKIYAEFCRDYIGRFVHHNPRNDQVINSSLAINTYMRMKNFGLEPNAEYWLDQPSTDCNGGRGCDGYSPAEDNTLDFILA